MPDIKLDERQLREAAGRQLDEKVRQYCDVCGETDTTKAQAELERHGFVVLTALNARFDRRSSPGISPREAEPRTKTVRNPELEPEPEPEPCGVEYAIRTQIAAADGIHTVQLLRDHIDRPSIAIAGCENLFYHANQGRENRGKIGEAGGTNLAFWLRSARF